MLAGTYTVKCSQMAPNTLQWSYNESEFVSNRRRPDCLLNRLLQIKEYIKPLAFVKGIHRSPVDSPHKGLVTQKMFPFDDVIMAHR